MKNIILKLIDKMFACFGIEVKKKYRFLKRKVRFLNLKAPKTFSQKINYRMIHPLPVYSILADKIAVREFVKKKVGLKYLIPLYGIYDKITYDDIELLPDSFILKANHGCGFNKIVHNKRSENINNLVKIANGWLDIDYSKKFNERHYTFIKPRLFAEELLIKKGKVPEDYKINVFNKDNSSFFIYIQIDTDRFGRRKQAFFMEDWSPAPFKTIYENNSEEYINKKPKCLEEMLFIAKKLSLGFGYCRIDMYIMDGKIYFGEMTFTPYGGTHRYDPQEWDLILGERFGWPEKNYSFEDLINKE